MTMNVWDLSGVLVRIGDHAAEYARKANLCKKCDYDDMKDTYNNFITGLQVAVSCFRWFDLKFDTDIRGYYTKVYITYKGDILGEPWIIGD